MFDERHVFGQFRVIERRCADRIAVSFRGADGWCGWSYSELGEQARRMAEMLTKRGVRRGDAIGLVAHRCPETIAAMLGILSIGASYVPVDPVQPAARAKLLFELARVRLVVTTRSVNGSGPSMSIETIDGVDAASSVSLQSDSDEKTRLLESHELSAEDPAYVMFTSGSSGKPKGVIVPHRAITRLVAGQDYLRFDSSRVFLHAASMSFDASTLEVWGPLLNGGRCVLYPHGTLPTAEGLRAIIAATGVTTAWLTASLFHAIVSHDVQCLAGIEELVVGGEVLSVAHVHTALAGLPGTQLVNGYGPTENTTFSACYRIPKDLSPDAARVPIGRAIRGTQLLVVDEALHSVTPGTGGQLVAMGDGVALGYLDQPELTGKQFVDLVGADGVTRRGYLTGDFVVEMPDGELDFLGRRDDQVKIDGSRIEPLEVEAVISGLSGVSQCRVQSVRSPLGPVRLAAYVVMDEEGTLDLLKQAMAEVLPAYMVPHQVVLMSALPLNTNGKLAVESLPSPWPAAKTTASSRRAGSLALVEQVWSEILGFSPESWDVNFFDAGGRSLEAVKLNNLLERRLAITLDMTFAFEFPTVRRQATKLMELLGNGGASLTDVPGPRPDR